MMVCLEPKASESEGPTPLKGCVYGTRKGLLTPNYCPESAMLVCYGSNNTNTLTTANSI